MSEPIGPGAPLGAYRIEEEIGRGGMGVVYRARHVELDRRAAVKVIAPELAREDAFRRRFVRESRSASAIDHPNVLPVYEAGESEDGVLYMATRLIEGVDLRQLIGAAGPLEVERVATVVSQVAAALDAAHSRGLVHRDVKPANVLLSRGVGPAGSDHAYLTDFGLSKRVGDESMTEAGRFVGTVDYVAPEQIQGEQVDGRADVYALGCVLHFCLTGEPPFRRDEEMAVMWAHVNTPPPRVSGRHSLPAELDEVMTTALAKDRVDRHQSAGALAAALRGVLGLDPGAWEAPAGALAAGAVAEDTPRDPLPTGPGSGRADAERLRAGETAPAARRLGGKGRRRPLARRLLVGAGIAAAALVAALVAMIVPGGEDGRVAAAVEEAMTSSGPAGCTALQTQRFVEQTTFLEGGEAISSCQEHAGNPNARTAQVSNVDVDGASASAEVALSGGDLGAQTLAVTLVEVDGSWKLDRISSFVAYDRDSFIEGLRRSFAEGEGFNREERGCLGDQFALSTDATLQDLVLSGDPERFVALVRPCVLDDEDHIAAVLEEAMTTTDPRHCTELLTRRFVEQAQFEEGGTAVERCEQGAETPEAQSAHVAEIEVDGVRATAQVALSGGDRGEQTLDVALVEEAGRWRLDRLRSFVDFDRDDFLAGMRRSMHEEPGAMTLEDIRCVLDRFERSSDEQLQQFILSGDRDAAEPFTRPCRDG